VVSSGAVAKCERGGASKGKGRQAERLQKTEDAEIACKPCKTKKQGSWSSRTYAETLLYHLSSLGLDAVVWVVVGSCFAAGTVPYEQRRRQSPRVGHQLALAPAACDVRQQSTSRTDLAVVVVSRGINRLSCARREESSCCLRTGMSAAGCHGVQSARHIHNTAHSQRGNWSANTIKPCQVAVATCMCESVRVVTAVARVRFRADSGRATSILA
jgi:hypothetical protein